MGYMPPFTITNEMLELVASISEKIGKISSLRDLEMKPHLRRNNRIKSIHSSLKIEANSLSLSEVRDVINGHLVIGDRKDIQEIKNAFAAYEKLPEIDPYSIGDLKMVHGVMTAYLVEESGVFRHGEEGVFHDEECIFIAPPPHLVPMLMDDLFAWMQANQETIHPLILSAVFHYEFVFIHPFADGNGRMARLWHTAILSKWRSVFSYIPIESQIEKFQDAYYNVIAKCHVNGNSNLFIEFMLGQIDKALDEVTEQVSNAEKQYSEYVKRMLEVMEYDVPYTARSIMGALGLKSRETFRKNYMNPALDERLVVMTIPDKPNSRNQRYVKIIQG